jgi:hypothetical protein
MGVLAIKGRARAINSSRFPGLNFSHPITNFIVGTVLQTGAAEQVYRVQARLVDREHHDRSAEKRENDQKISHDRQIPASRRSIAAVMSP